MLNIELINEGYHKIIIMTEANKQNNVTKIDISQAFDELKDQEIKFHGVINSVLSSSSWQWAVFQNKHDKDGINLSFCRHLKSELQAQEAIKSAKIYSGFLKNTMKNELILKALAPITKYSLYKGSNEAEILQKYCGFPLPNLWENILHINNSVVESGLKIHFMHQIFKECISKLSGLVCGTLCSENILFDPNKLMARFQDAYMIRHAKDITPESPLYIEKPNIYYIQTFHGGPSKELKASQAITADIKALALIVWELGLPKDISLKEFIKDGKLLEIEALFQQETIFKSTKNQPKSIQLYDILKKILSTNGDLTYEMNEMSNFVKTVDPLNLEFKTVKIEEKNEFQLNGKPFITNKMHLRRLKDNIYQISYPDGFTADTFIIKKYTDVDCYNREKEILTKIETTNATTKINSLAKIKKDIETGPQELAIEYCGISLPNKFKGAAKKGELIKNLFGTIVNICEDLIKVRLYHGDIKPANIAISETWECKLFDYDISTTDITPVDAAKDKFDEDLYRFPITGSTVDYCAPEVLECMLGGKPSVELNPFKADLYSLAKSILSILTNCYKGSEILQTLYGVKFTNESNYINEMAELMKNEPLMSFKSHKTIKDQKGKAIYMYLHRDDLIKRIIDFNVEYIRCENSVLKIIMKYLALMMDSDPAKRPNMQELRNIYNDIIELGKLETFKYTEHYEKQVTMGEYDVYCIESLNDYQDLTGFPFLVSILKDGNINDDEENKEDANFEVEKRSIYHIIKRQNLNKDANNNFDYQFEYDKEPIIDSVDDSMINPLMIHVHCIVDKNIEPVSYFIGGLEDYEPVKTVYALEKKELAKKCDMNCARAEFGVVSWNNYIAVAGGKADANYIAQATEFIYLDNCEIYNALSDSWAPLITLKQHKKEVAMAYKNRKIYIIGGIIDLKDVDIDIATSERIYGNMIEIVNVDSNQLSTEGPYTISDSLGNSICSCPAILLDDNVLLIFRDGLLASEDEMYMHSAYEITLVQMDKSAHIAPSASEKSLQDSQYEYTGLSAHHCIEFSNKYLIIPNFNEFNYLNDGELLEFDKKDKTIRSSVLKKGVLLTN